MIREMASAFESISLPEMEQVKLLDRVETKFVFRQGLLPILLEEMGNNYRILETCGSRIHPYQTIYFDTPELKLYHVHRQGKLNRYKIRFRKYCDSDLCFFEIKFKNNKGRTIKWRKVHTGGLHVLDETAEILIKKKTPVDPAMMKPVIEIRYDRMTLVNRDLTERITVDTGLTFCSGDQVITIPGLCIAEVKEEKNGHGGFPCLMHRLKVQPMSVSKFCMGIILLHPEIRRNTFKPKLLRIQKILKDVN
jgi:hypothetical protein